jgi:hypothetical protein
VCTTAVTATVSAPSDSLAADEQAVATHACAALRSSQTAVVILEPRAEEG